MPARSPRWHAGGYCVLISVTTTRIAASRLSNAVALCVDCRLCTTSAAVAVQQSTAGQTSDPHSIKSSMRHWASHNLIWVSLAVQGCCMIGVAMAVPPEADAGAGCVAGMVNGLHGAVVSLQQPQLQQRDGCIALPRHLRLHAVCGASSIVDESPTAAASPDVSLLR